MEFFINAPAYIKVGASFLGILIAYRAGLSLGYSILIFAVGLTVWTNAGLPGFSHQLHMLMSPENYVLLIVILLLLFFTESLDKTGKMKKTIDALQTWLKNPRALLAGFPALIGLLPMPGGALFSAPLVEAVDNQNRLPAAQKSAINYWFRHIWEYWWPLYPGIILAIKYSGLPSGLFFLIQMPFTIAAATAGYFFIIKKVARSSLNETTAGRGKLDFKAVSQTLWPIGILVGLSLVGSFVIPGLGTSRTLGNILAMVVALLVGLVAIYWRNIRFLKPAMNMFKKENTWEMMLLVLGIQVFSGALTVPIGHGGTLVTLMRDEFLAMGIPLLLVIALIPFISGAVTGVAFGFVGASFPIVFALIGTSPPLNVVLAATTFAYGCGYMGMILSPVHICFVVSNEYFKSRMFDTYKYIFVPSLCIFAAGCIMSASYFYFVR